MNLFSKSDAPVTELANQISVGENLIQELSKFGVEPLVVNQHVQFSCLVGINYFLQIAKQRAFKMLWANVLKAYQVEGEMPGMFASSSKSEIC